MIKKKNQAPGASQRPWFDLADVVIGVDEVGRGCLAGPVVSCALALKETSMDHQLFDSKSLKAQVREKIVDLLNEKAVYALGEASVEEIDELNILQASLLSMRRAVVALQRKMPLKNALILIDGNQSVPGIPLGEQRTVIQGDAIYAPISAASIVAKVYRDKLMKGLDARFPQYAFGIHKGYGTSLHREAIKTWGPCMVHRRSFKGVREFCSP